MIVFPMAGSSRRFQDAGFTLPKYMLRAHGASLFAHAVASFAHLFNRLPFLFICRDIFATDRFIAQECRRLGIWHYQTVVLTSLTRGQAETVAQGLIAGGVDPRVPLTVFNIDTFRPDFHFPDLFDLDTCDGFLEVFRDVGSNWSYVRPARVNHSGRETPINQVLETAEKRPISDLSCTGLYHFRRVKDFLRAYRQAAEMPPSRHVNGELFVAPLYNHLIAEGADIRYCEVARAAVIFCGVPSEYDAFVASASPFCPRHTPAASDTQKRYP